MEVDDPTIDCGTIVYDLLTPPAFITLEASNPREIILDGANDPNDVLLFSVPVTLSVYMSMYPPSTYTETWQYT